LLRFWLRMDNDSGGVSRTLVQLGVGSAFLLSAFWLTKTHYKHQLKSKPSESYSWEIKELQQPKTVGTVTQVVAYPIKSCAGISLEHSDLWEYGLKYDRRWMVVKEKTYRFITQRNYPKMALIKPQFEDDCLKVTAPGMGPLKVGFESNGEPVSAKVWLDEINALDQGDEAAEWFSSFLGFPCRLVSIAQDYERSIPVQYKSEGLINQAALVDRFPFLLCTEQSLEALNDHLDGDKKTMKNFRPNIVVKMNDGLEPFAEDSWYEVNIGNEKFYCMAGCSRCKFTTVNQEEGIFGDDEPLRTLKIMRKGVGPNEKDGFFGQHLNHDFKGNAAISVGDPVTLISSKNPKLLLLDYF